MFTKHVMRKDYGYIRILLWVTCKLVKLRIYFVVYSFKLFLKKCALKFNKLHFICKKSVTQCV